jgi:hypothetical protein
MDDHCRHRPDIAESLGVTQLVFQFRDLMLQAVHRFVSRSII